MLKRIIGILEQHGVQWRDAEEWIEIREAYAFSENGWVPCPHTILEVLYLLGY